MACQTINPPTNLPSSLDHSDLFRFLSAGTNINSRKLDARACEAFRRSLDLVDHLEARLEDAGAVH